MKGTVTPLDIAQRALRATPPEKLLDRIEELTHRIHGLRGPDADRQRLVDLLEMRGMLRAEVLRRIGGAR